MKNNIKTKSNFATAFYLFSILLLWNTTSCSESSSPKTVQVQTPIGAEPDTTVIEQTTASPADKEAYRSGVLSCSGTIQVPPKFEVSLHTKIEGLIQNISVLEGERVKKGTVLANIEHADIIILQENYLKAKASFEFIAKELERKTKLHDEKAISDKEFQQLQSDFQLKKAAFESYKNQLSFAGISVNRLEQGTMVRSVQLVAPISGFITQVHVKNGMYTNLNQKAFTIIDDSHKHLHLNVFPADIYKVKVGQAIRFKVPGNERDYKASVHLVGKAVDYETNAISVHAHLDEDYPELVVGNTVFAEIEVTKP